MSSGRQQHQQSFNDRYAALILEEAEKIYNMLMTELTNRAMAAAAEDIRGSWLPSLGNNINNRQKLPHRSNVYQIEWQM